MKPNGKSPWSRPRPILRQGWMQPTACPVCHKLLDAWTCEPGKDGPPSPGDVTLCVNCGTWLKFDAKLQLRLPDPIEKILIEANPMIKAMTRRYNAWKASDTFPFRYKK